MFDTAIFVKRHGVYMQVEIDDTVYFSKRADPPEDRMFKQVLLENIEDYLGGLEGECRINREDHEAAREWIFNSHPLDDLGFDQMWKNFFPYITPEEAKKALQERFIQRSKRIKKKGRRDGYKHQSFHGRKKKAVPGRHDTGARSTIRIAIEQET
jgi:hypothetical protein